MSGTVATEQPAAQAEADTPGMLTKMAERVYVRRFSDRDRKHGVDGLHSSPQMSDKRSGKEDAES